MARKTDILRLILFCIFFSVGAGAVALSLLAGELKVYYENKQALWRIEHANREVEQLTERYTQQIEQIERDPNQLRKLRWAVLGEEPNEPGKVFPQVDARELARVMAVIETMQEPEPNMVPPWVKRSNQVNMRYGLFFAGAGLIVTTFIFFGVGRETKA